MDAPDRDKPQPQLEIGPVSGFPEWLPPVRLAEQLILDSVRRTYELYGFTPIETPAVERLSVLAAKGGSRARSLPLGGPLKRKARTQALWVCTSTSRSPWLDTLRNIRTS